ncbi:hypothetical protein BpHYR1_001483 [Brachionus plicatilis]|uniref:Uncharacterized protein n=1 Tax=Brachionus plicatilis TaxID=10195 RepID=A0A3M7QKL9_BRAPC|nr:hypothetical protein BpHYR1_001483 [Brachionus plicatilis]
MKSIILTQHWNIQKKQNSSIRKMGKKNKRYQFKSLKLLILNTTLNFSLKLPGMIEFFSFNQNFKDVKRINNKLAKS